MTSTALDYLLPYSVLANERGLAQMRRRNTIAPPTSVSLKLAIEVVVATGSSTLIILKFLLNDPVLITWLTT